MPHRPRAPRIPARPPRQRRSPAPPAACTTYPATQAGQPPLQRVCEPPPAGQTDAPQPAPATEDPRPPRAPVELGSLLPQPALPRRVLTLRPPVLPDLPHRDASASRAAATHEKPPATRCPARYGVDHAASAQRA